MYCVIKAKLKERTIAIYYDLDDSEKHYATLKSQMQSIIYCMILITWNVQKRKILSFHFLCSSKWLLATREICLKFIWWKHFRSCRFCVQNFSAGYQAVWQLTLADILVYLVSVGYHQGPQLLYLFKHLFLVSWQNVCGTPWQRTPTFPAGPSHHWGSSFPHEIQFILMGSSHQCKFYFILALLQFSSCSLQLAGQLTYGDFRPETRCKGHPVWHRLLD